MNAADWMLVLVAAGLGTAGLAWVAWALLADRADGRRRCPRCFYDLGPREAKCPECAHEVRSERSTRRTRRRWKRAALGLLPLVMAGGLVGFQQFRGTAWYQAAPSRLLIEFYAVASPAIQQDPAVHDELERRIIFGELSDRSKRRLVSICARELDARTDPARLGVFLDLLEQLDTTERKRVVMSGMDRHPDDVVVGLRRIDRLPGLAGLADDRAADRLVGLTRHAEETVERRAVDLVASITDRRSDLLPLVLARYGAADDTYGAIRESPMRVARPVYRGVPRIPSVSGSGASLTYPVPDDFVDAFPAFLAGLDAFRDDRTGLLAHLRARTKDRNHNTSTVALWLLGRLDWQGQSTRELVFDLVDTGLRPPDAGSRRRHNHRSAHRMSTSGSGSDSVPKGRAHLVPVAASLLGLYPDDLIRPLLVRALRARNGAAGLVAFEIIAARPELARELAAELEAAAHEDRSWWHRRTVRVAVQAGADPVELAGAIAAHLESRPLASEAGVDGAFTDLVTIGVRHAEAAALARRATELFLESFSPGPGKQHAVERGATGLLAYGVCSGDALGTTEMLLAFRSRLRACGPQASQYLPEGSPMALRGLLERGLIDAVGVRPLLLEPGSINVLYQDLLAIARFPDEMRGLRDVVEALATHQDASIVTAVRYVLHEMDGSWRRLRD